MSNPWDILSSKFDTTRDTSEISPRVADNILIAWPVILNFIKQHVPAGENLRLLEYGCGTGSFAYKLRELNFDVTAIDSSEAMIAKAKSAYGDKINFLNGDSSILSTLEPFSIITSVMTFQFVKNIEKTFKELANVLAPGGIFVFAVHNPKQVKDFLQKEILFEDFDSKVNPKEGYLNLEGNKISIFIRTAEEYNSLLQVLGFKPLLESYPPFTKEFLEKYPTDDPTDLPEFLILGYKKA